MKVRFLVALLAVVSWMAWVLWRLRGRVRG